MDFWIFGFLDFWILYWFFGDYSETKRATSTRDLTVSKRPDLLGLFRRTQSRGPNLRSRGPNLITWYLTFHWLSTGFIYNQLSYSLSNDLIFLSLPAVVFHSKKKVAKCWKMTMRWIFQIFHRLSEAEPPGKFCNAFLRLENVCWKLIYGERLKKYSFNFNLREKVEEKFLKEWFIVKLVICGDVTDAGQRMNKYKRR